jgi:hypothetical protein
MKAIQPVQIWTPSGDKSAEFLSARIINDDLATSATFYWELLAKDDEGNAAGQLSQGNVTMSGEDYQNWDDSNDTAYQFVAGQIGVVII